VQLGAAQVPFIHVKGSAQLFASSQEHPSVPEGQASHWFALQRRPDSQTLPGWHLQPALPASHTGVVTGLPSPPSGGSVAGFMLVVASAASGFSSSPQLAIARTLQPNKQQ
jgi:hypothetical protein